MHRDLRREFEPLRIAPAVVMRPVVIGACQCGGVIGGKIVVAKDLASAGAVHDGNVDPLDIHRRQTRGRVETLCPRHLEMRVAGPAAPP
jgi:hypothetical protein